MVNFVTMATNRYRFLGERLRDQLAKFYRDPYILHVGTEEPMDGVQWHPRSHPNWVTAVSDKFSFQVSLPFHPDDLVFWIDADTNLNRDVYQSDIEGELVGAEHFASNDGLWRYDNHPISSCYVPKITPLPKTWYMGCFVGGRWSSYKWVLENCIQLQEMNRSVGHHPNIDDESYTNYHYHYYRPQRTIPFAQFPFVVSDKGGYDNLRTN